MERYTKEERRKLRALKRLSSARDSEWEGFITHSTMYHRMFEGYSERQVPRDDAKGMRIERFYVGDYYVRNRSSYGPFSAKLVYTLLYLLAVGCAITAFAQPTGYNSVWYGVIPMFALIITLILFAYNLFNCLTSPRKMEAYHYNCFGRLITSSLIISIIALIYALLSLIYLFVTDSGNNILLTSLFAVLTSVLFFVLFTLERNAQYEVIENEKSPHSDSVVIC